MQFTPDQPQGQCTDGKAKQQVRYAEAAADSGPDRGEDQIEPEKLDHRAAPGKTEFR
ncbi:hypothetical protein D3C71_2080330 [compost metagenome]